MLSVKVIALCFVVLGMVAANGARAANPVVVMETSMGTIKIELFEDKAPITVKNFLEYVEDKHYDGMIFHRVIDGFMIQGGGFEPGMKQKKTKDPIKNESDNGLSNLRGTLAMARTSRARQRHQPVLHQRQGQHGPRPGERRRQGRLLRLRPGDRGHGRGRQDQGRARPAPRWATATCPTRTW